MDNIFCSRTIVLGDAVAFLREAIRLSLRDILMSLASI